MDFLHKLLWCLSFILKKFLKFEQSSLDNSYKKHYYKTRVCMNFGN